MGNNEDGEVETHCNENRDELKATVWDIVIFFIKYEDKAIFAACGEESDARYAAHKGIDMILEGDVADKADRKESNSDFR